MEAKFFCFLEIIRVGYKGSTNAQGSILFLKLGFSHEIRLQVTPLVRVFCFKPNLIYCTRMDHQKLTQFVVNIPKFLRGKVYNIKTKLYVKNKEKKSHVIYFRN